MRNLYTAPICLLALLLTTAPPAFAQGVQRSNKQKSPSAEKPVDARLDPVPLKIEALGLSIHPPAASSVSAQRANGQVSVFLSEPIANPRWTCTIQLLHSTLDQPTAKAQVQDHLNALRERGSPFEVLSNNAVTINNLDGQLCYIRQTTTAGQQYISGWLILPAGHQTFLVAASLIMPDAVEEFQPTLEASFHTIEITSQEEISLRTRSQIEAGRQLLESITPQQLKSLAARNSVQWRRIYKPSDSAMPDQEIGYMMLNVFAGKRGMLTPSRDEIDYDAADHEIGLIVRANVRVLEAKDIRDVEMLYWMSWDQGEEAFSVRGTRRQGEASISEAITGIRTRASVSGPAPTLTVVAMGEFTRAREPVQWNVPDVYLSQALNWILPQLLPQDSREHTLSYYYFDMAIAQPTLKRRIDRWKPDTSGIGKWQLNTEVGESNSSIVTYYDANGHFIRRQHPDGSRTEPIDLMKLRRLWVTKKLPLNADDFKRKQ